MPTMKLPGSGGLGLRADVLGDDVAPGVLLLHGGGQTRHSWKSTATRLAAAGYYVASVDARGHGESEWSESGAYSIDDYAADVRSLVSWMDRPTALVGASLGGISSMLAIAEPPEAPCVALVLVDVVPGMNQEGKDRIGAFMRTAPEGFASVEEAADAVARYLPHRPRPADVSGLRKNLRVGDNGRWHWHFDPEFMEGLNAETDNRERLDAAARRVTVPTLLVRGELSEIVDEDGAAAFLALVPHAEELVVERAAHMVAGDKNDPLSDAVVGFLRRVHPAQPVARGA